jgi:hypothetical protein
MNGIVLPPRAVSAAKTRKTGRDDLRDREVIAMHQSLKLAATALFSGILVISASAQEPRAGNLTAAPLFYAAFPWYGNALDQKILDAQAQMLVPRHAVRRVTRHHRHLHH